MTQHGMLNIFQVHLLLVAEICYIFGHQQWRFWSSLIPWPVIDFHEENLKLDHLGCSASKSAYQCMNTCIFHQCKAKSTGFLYILTLKLVLCERAAVMFLLAQLSQSMPIPLRAAVCRAPLTPDR